MSETKIRRERPAAKESASQGPTVGLPVLLGATAVTVAVTAFCLISPMTAESGFAATVGWATRWFGWF